QHGCLEEREVISSRSQICGNYGLKLPDRVPPLLRCALVGGAPVADVPPVTRLRWMRTEVLQGRLGRGDVCADVERLKVVLLRDPRIYLLAGGDAAFEVGVATLLEQQAINGGIIHTCVVLPGLASGCGNLIAGDIGRQLVTITVGVESEERDIKRTSI